MRNGRFAVRGKRAGSESIVGRMAAYWALMAALCIAAILSSPATANAARNIQVIKSALAMYESDFTRAKAGVSGAVTDNSLEVSPDSAGNSFSAHPTAAHSPDSSATDLTLDGSGFHFTSALSRGTGSGDVALSGFSGDFWVDSPIAYTFSGHFSSNNGTPTAGSFSVTLDDLGAGTNLFTHSDVTIPPGFSTDLTAANSTGPLSGVFLPGTTYRLTIGSELDDDGLASPPISGNSNVLLSFSEAPEPASVALMLAGVGMLLARGRRRVAGSPRGVG